jgi:hypothetical protein
LIVSSIFYSNHPHNNQVKITMNTFASAVESRTSNTENGMKAFATSLNANVDFFYKMGSMRSVDPVPEFSKAFVENRELALRSLQFLRDVRQGMGERKTFREILKFLEVTDPEAAKLIASRIPELGRFDDLFSFKTRDLQTFALAIYSQALLNANKLAGKWAKRKGPEAEALRKFMGLSPRAYRKMVVSLSSTVEQQMCSNRWDEINYSHVPSVAHARNRRAFGRHSPERYQQYLADLKANKSGVKINASAVFPHDVIKTILGKCDYFYEAEEILRDMDSTELESIIQQWNALPNFVGESNILPMVDVSGSMLSGGVPSPMIVAVGLGLYLCDKNQGAFKDLVLTFSNKSKLEHLRGNVVQKALQMTKMDWAMNTDIERALKEVLRVAVEGKVPQDQMPQALVILSDMQFDQCVSDSRESYMEMMARMFEGHGYQIPSVIFWNLNGAKTNVPVRYTEKGTALISGYSPNILKTVLSGNLDELTPEKIMLNAIMDPRYDVDLGE